MSDVIAVSGTGRSMDAVCSDAVRLISEHLDPAKAVEEVCCKYSYNYNNKQTKKCPLRSCVSPAWMQNYCQVTTFLHYIPNVHKRIVCMC